MRLVCPNCGAQYDVPLEVIPEAGRDVQCSNCGHTWFQKRVTQGAPARPPRPAPKPAAAPDPGPGTVPETETEARDDHPPEPTTPPSRVDPEMAELFRQERDFAAQQRRAESLETQPDLGLAPPDEDERTKRARESRERMARMKGEDLAEAPERPKRGTAREQSDDELHAAAAAAAAASRKDLLPDVEEINQTLRSSSEPRGPKRAATAEEDSAPRSGPGFARGFTLMVVAAVIALAVYLNVPQISQQVPAAAPYLEAYAEAVDKGRYWLDEQLKSLLTQLDQMSAEKDAGGADPDPDPIADN